MSVLIIQTILVCFKTEKYFADATEELRKDFTFQKDILDPCQEFINSIGGSDKCIFSTSS